MSNINDEFWAYLAGIIDATGTISIDKSVDHRFDGDINRYNLKIYISQAKRGWLENLKEKTDHGSVKIMSPSSTSKVPSYQLVFSPRQADFILSKIIPFLQIKKDQAEQAIEFRKSFEKVGGKMSKVPNGKRGGLNKSKDSVNLFREKCYRKLQLAKRTNEPIIVSKFRE